MVSAPARIHIELVPMWSQIKNLRHFVREFCTGLDLHAAVADQVAMATSELLENATKYACTRWVRYDLHVLRDTAEIGVTNEVTPDQRDHLLRFVEQVLEGDPLQVYLTCLERQNEGGVSQAGLARIRYEAGAELSIRWGEQEVTVVALIPL
jgi:hypothetical protein